MDALEDLQKQLREKTAERDAADEEIASIERKIAKARRNPEPGITVFRGVSGPGDSRERE